MYLHGGYDDIFPKIEEALQGKAIGESVQVKLQPDEAFGEYDAEMVQIEPRKDFPKELQVGMQFEGDFYGTRIGIGQIALDPANIPEELSEGATLFRNRDQEFERALEKESADRRVSLKPEFRETGSGFTLSLTDEDGIIVTVDLPRSEKIGCELAQQPEQAMSKLKENPHQCAAAGGPRSHPRNFPSTGFRETHDNACHALHPECQQQLDRFPRSAGIWSGSYRSRRHRTRVSRIPALSWRMPLSRLPPSSRAGLRDPSGTRFRAYRSSPLCDLSTSDGYFRIKPGSNLVALYATQTHNLRHHK